jgi:hypothetical protein
VIRMKLTAPGKGLFNKVLWSEWSLRKEKGTNPVNCEMDVNLQIFRTPDIGKAANYQVYFRSRD